MINSVDDHRRKKGLHLHVNVPSTLEHRPGGRRCWREETCPRLGHCGALCSRSQTVTRQSTWTDTHRNSKCVHVFFVVFYCACMCTNTQKHKQKRDSEQMFKLPVWTWCLLTELECILLWVKLQQEAYCAHRWCCFCIFCLRHNNLLCAEGTDRIVHLGHVHN